MPRTYKLEGIIVKRTNFGESDKIITIFTKQKGKKTLLAKGIRKIISKKASHLEILNHIVGFAAVGKKWDYLIEAQSLESFPGIKKDLLSIAYAYRIMELVDTLCPLEQQLTNIFSLVLTTLENLNDKKLSSNDLMNWFIKNLLIQAGYLPQDQRMSNRELNLFLGKVIERNLKSDILLTHLNSPV